MSLTKEDIFGADDLGKTEVQVPQWGGSVWVRSMMASERAEVEREFSSKKAEDDPAGFRGAVLTRTIVDEDGNRLFTAADLPKLLAKNAAAVEVVFDAACELNGFTAKDKKELEKN